MMIGQSHQLGALLAQLRRFASCDAPVLLEGETGTGKELAAREIHYASRRRDKPFVPVNCGALPESLIESELFGHRRGAFTDAKSAQSGLIEHAQHGTLFLDEVDSLSPKAQVTLLRFLQDSEYRPVGGGAICIADVRIIAATNTSLARLVADGNFRCDLLYRLNPLYVHLPPLRTREGDIAALAAHFLSGVTQRMNVAPKRWTDEALRALTMYAWPGNVRELENVVLRTCLCAEGLDIGLAELAVAEPALVAGIAVGAAAASADGNGLDNSALPLSSFSRPHWRLFGDTSSDRRISSDRRKQDAPLANAQVPDARYVAASFSAAKTSAIALFEHDYLIDLMRRAGGNVSVAARLSRIERRQLGKLLKKRGIEKEQFRSTD